MLGRARFLSSAARSALRRYPASISRSLRDTPPPLAADELAESWRRLTDTPGLAAACWLGHCSVMLRLGGLTILTDPVLSHVVGPKLGGRTFGAHRTSPAIADAGSLPAPDLVLISHAHYDHLDRPTLATLAGTSPNPARVITARRTRRLIPQGFSGVAELHWGNTTQIGSLRITALRPKHWGARHIWDIHRGYNSYLLEADGARVLFAGDTALTSAFDRLGPIDLAIFGIAAYDPWIHAHANPEQVWTMASTMPARALLPVHHSTFNLSNEPPDEPVRRLLRAAASPLPSSPSPRIILASPGEIVPLSPS